MTTAVVILNYNGVELMKQYLPSVVNNTPDAEIIVADNGSTDGSVAWLKEAYPTLRLVELDRNYGFADGYNRALQQVSADIFVLLNSDIETPPGWLAPLVGHLEQNGHCAACQPKILSVADPHKFEYAGAAGGFIDIYGYPFCRGRVMSHVETDNGQYNSPREIFWATGACLAIRSSVFNQVGGLDARFFAHQEEIDLCWRLKARGWSVACIPQSAVYHVGGGSLSYESPFKTRLNFRNNALLLYKNLPDKQYRRVAPIRILLDWVAALQMLVTGQPQNARAVLDARREFKRIRKDFVEDRKKNLSLTVSPIPSGIMPRLLLLEVYLKRHTRFDLLKIDE